MSELFIAEIFNEETGNLLLNNLDKNPNTFSERITPLKTELPLNYVGGFKEFMNFWQSHGLENISSFSSPLNVNQEAVVKKLMKKLKVALKGILGSELSLITTWYNQLSLTDIPFYHLISHQALLPKESFRCFYIDHLWWDALLDGALSLSVHNSFDEIAISSLKIFLKEEGQLENRSGRWGFLIRSKAIRDWEGIEFFAFSEK